MGVTNEFRNETYVIRDNQPKHRSRIQQCWEYLLNFFRNSNSEEEVESITYRYVKTPENLMEEDLAPVSSSEYRPIHSQNVSSFTDLTEKYTKTGRGGPSKLTETLNSYIGAMVQEILSHNGDVLKFSGDAFIVMWKLQTGMVMRDLAIEAIQTACVIQKHFGTYHTDVGVTLRVKLAIASGKTHFTSIGDPRTMSYYLITGKPVWDVKFAEGLCRGGDIIVAPSSWQWANPNEYVHEKLPDGVHTLIIACSAMWYQARTQDINAEGSSDKKDVERLRDDESASDSSLFDDDVPSTEAGAVLMNLTGDTLKIHTFEQVDYSLRPKVVKVAKMQIKDSLRSYMLRPVIRSVEMDESLEHLTEMRQVVILFINVITADIEKKKLISLVNSSYKLVCGRVDKMRGCVNKTSLFDKDLIFLCVFGLRGDKQELESQIGLRCASRVRQDLLAMEYVKSVTIAVTTGITYCGVVGHILRREYTVIGISVNKAARLMCAYNNKVVCDRESFLHSHLEARHFILQEPRYLKGITKVGPIYEFREQEKYNIPELVWSKYPLLGREMEIRVFRRILADLVKHSTAVNEMTQRARPEYNTLIIKGEHRIGKTRLLDEIAQNIPTGVSCNYISLVRNDAKVDEPPCDLPDLCTPLNRISYSLIHLIFSIPLGFNVVTTPKERENKLIPRLGRIRQPEFLCALNEPFNVNFAISEQYKALTETLKHKVLQKLLSKLTRGCFERLWVIIIDDAEYSDDDSMLLFRTIAKQDTVLFVLGVGRRIDMQYELHPAVMERAQIIELKHIDKWYHAALACQFLNVSGIPVELEKLIQEKSHGNPGWIESFLVSLMQSGGLVIMNVHKTEAEVMGYVLPPVAMLKRFIAENTVLVDIEDDEDEREDKWEMYKTSFKDNAIPSPRPLNDVHQMQATDNDSATIVVCKFAKNFTLEDESVEMTMDVMILKLFDSLTPLDQILLKCASVLGENVNRRMLQSLMEEISARELALAVRKLFEIRILGCGVGDFTASSKMLIFHRNIRNVSVGKEVRCECIGLTIPDELADLPRYASCGLMRFKISMFRETTYRLLTEHQKMELHSKALKFLRQHTRRCLTCGELQFVKLLGKTTMQSVRKRRPTVERLLNKQQFTEANSIPEKEEKNAALLNQADEERAATCLDVFRKTSRKPMKTFSNVDFANCRCHLILTTVYSQMLEHCHGIGKKELMLTAILEFAEVCLTSYNIPQARSLLNEAENLLCNIFDADEEELIVLPYLTAKIQTLEGRCYLESGIISEAQKKLDSAMKTLGYHFPRSEFLIRLKSVTQLELLKWKLAYPKRWRDDAVDVDTKNYIEQLANCLALMFEVYRTKGMKRHARLAVSWSLNTVLDSSQDFLTICTSFTNMMITAHVYQTKSIIPYLENASLNFCAEKEDYLEFQELKAIAELYASVFFSRWLRGEIHKAIKIGFIATRLAQTMGSIFLKLLVLPMLAHLLMISCRHSEVVALLRELEFTSQSDLDKSGRTWYYAICADVQLDTGLTILSYRNCEQYYLKEGETMISLRDPEAERRYFTSMWLWCVRTQQWEASRVWDSRNVTSESVMDEHIVAATITALKKLEGLLILYGKKIDKYIHTSRCVI
ncbi:Adenylate cyclase type 10 [Harpegnathos saltator]|uniref:Adenylate cyclase type 10 n=1 Tax=Harpegnathos saltator TaxID=610380 RepID=E2BEP5_HARSA|nr:Adenylate cyclase type 10 [Harpegnathos saltator]